MIVAHHLSPDVDDKNVENEDSKPIAIKGTEGMLVTFAKCCRPIPGDPVVGFVSTGKGIVVHRDNCNNIAEYRDQEDKMIPMQWAEDISGDYMVNIRIHANNERGVLAKITSKLADADANIVNMQIDEHDGTHYRMLFLVSVKDRVHLAKIIKKLRLLPSVVKLGRVSD